MADDYNLEIGVEADASDAIRDMREAASAVAELGDSFREIATLAASTARSLNKVEKGVSGASASTKKATADVRQNAQALSEQANAAKQVAQESKTAASQVRNLGVGLSTPGTGNTRAGSGSSGVYVTAAERESLEATNHARAMAAKYIKAQQDAIKEVVKANIADTQAWRAKNSVIAETAKVTGTYAGSAREVAERMAATGFASDSAGESVEGFRDSLFTARFALHDISNTTAIAGAALLAFSAVGINAAATYEDAMAGIQRTTGATSSQIAQIREQYVELAQTIPGGFANLAQIGELAGQLNIPTERLSEFTRTVAMFSSSTDVAVQASAEAFGRLDTLLPDVQGNYEALGSSILNVGINSVATESSIISTTTQIAAAGAQAGFAASEVIGLAAAYASLGIAPEASRGTTIRIFSEIRQAASEGGAALENFAAIAGMSADEFQSGWLNGNSSEVFLDFLRGLQSEGANAETVLRQLGITGVRDINALLRLSQNVEVVTASFSDAADGMSDATQLATSFGITSATLNSRLELLGQSFEALLATLGETGSGPLKEFINLLIDLMKTVTDLASDPFVQWTVVLGGLFTIITGGMLLLTSFIARFGALRIALRTTQVELDGLTAAAMRGTTQISALGMAGIKSAGWLTQMGNLAKTTGWMLAFTAGITVVTAAIDGFSKANRSSVEVAKEAWGDLSDLSSALRKDTEELGSSAEAFGTVEGQITTLRKSANGWVADLEKATGATATLADETDRTVSSTKAATFYIGEHTNALIANKLASDETVTSAYKLASEMQNLGYSTPDMGGYLKALARNDVDGAKAILEEYRAYVTEISKENAIAEAAGQGSAALQQEVSNAIKMLDLMEKTGTVVDGAFQGAADQITKVNDINAALNVTLNDTSIEASEATNKMSELADAIESAFSAQNAFSAVADDVRDLAAGIAESGDSFNAFSESGAANLSNFQGAIGTIIAAGSALGLSTAESVSVLFLQLQRMGVDTANLLASVANIPGMGAAGVAQVANTVGGSRKLSAAGQYLSDSLGGVADASRQAARGIGGAGGAAGGAAKEMRTLADYASDLEKVWKRAFDIRFGSEQALDKITSSWISMAEGIEKANKELEEAQRRIDELTTDNNSLMYFQQVAIDYGDALRAAEIADELAKNNAELAEANKEAADAQASMDKSLTGNSKSAIANRGEMAKLVGEYQDYLASLASSGMSQAELSAKAKQLRAEFVSQATQMGYSAHEVEKYAVAFDDMTLAIDRVPRNVTIEADINPALTALKEFEAAARKSGGAAGGGYRGAFGDAIKDMPTPIIPQPYIDGNMYELGFLNGRRIRGGIIDGIGRIQIGDGGYKSSGGRDFISAFSTGGYTGGGDARDIAGLVHKREFVVNAENTQRLGLPFLSALNSGKTPMQSGLATGTAGGGNPGIVVVELSAQDRALLAAAGNVSLSIDGKVVAQATNSANFVSTRRGTN